jgi:hypothetical protein
MSDQPNQVTLHEPVASSASTEAVARTYTRRELAVKRGLFYGGVLLWVVILLIPLSVMLLAIRGEFRFNLPGDLPNREVRVWMIMEKDERGIVYSRPFVADRNTDAIVMQTNVRYMLWEGESEVVSYCQTYTRAGGAESWQMEESLEGSCE